MANRLLLVQPSCSHDELVAMVHAVAPSFALESVNLSEKIRRNHAALEEWQRQCATSAIDFSLLLLSEIDAAWEALENAR
jgi:hypothetical protein